MPNTDVILREIRPEDLEMIRTWRNSKEVSQYMYNDKLIGPEEHLLWFDKIKQDKTCKYWIAEYKGEPVGFGGIYDINMLFRSCYWTFHLGNTELRGAKIGRKMEFQILSYVFDELGLNKLRGEVFVFNTAVIKMHESFGFRREAYFREHCYKNDKFEDVIGIGLLKREWDQLKKSLEEKIFGA